MNISTIDRQSLLGRLPIAEGLLVAVAVFWGTSYGLTKDALLYVSVLGFIGIRFSLTFFLLLPCFVADYRKGHAKDWKSAIPTGVILLGIFIAETFGVAYTTASNAAFLISLCVVITPFVEWLVYRRSLNRSLCMFAVISVVGVCMLTLNVSMNIQLNQGDGYILLAAFLRACMVVVTKKTLESKELTAISITMVQSGIVAIGAFSLLFLNEGTPFPLLPDSIEFWWITLYLVVFCTVFAFFAQNYALKRTSATKVSLLMGSEPAFGALFAILWLGETLSIFQYLGGALILIATIKTAINK